MRLSIENGAVVLSQERKNIHFLNECYGLFSGAINGKQKMYWLGQEAAHCADYAIESNARNLSYIVACAKLCGDSGAFPTVEIDEEVTRLNTELQAKARAIKERRRADKLQQQREEEARQKWERLCKNGCGKCINLAYDVDIPICRQTGQKLEERNVPQVIRRIHYCFKPEPFPSERCPFNINKKNKEKTTV